MDNFNPKDEDFRVWAMIVCTRRAIYRAMAKELQKCRLTVEEAAAMFMIRAIEAVGSNPIPTEISRWLFREPHSTSTLLVALIRGGAAQVYSRDRGRHSVASRSQRPRPSVNCKHLASRGLLLPADTGLDRTDQSRRGGRQ